MPKLNPFLQEIAQVEVTRKDFTDPRKPGSILTLFLRPLVGLTENTTMIAKAQELIAKFVDAGIDETTGKKKQVAVLPDVKGRPIKITAATCRSAAQIWAMQGGASEDTYGPEELLMFSATMPTAFYDAADWSMDLNEAEGAEEKNDLREPTESPSEPPSTTPDSIQLSISEETLSSEEPTSA